MTLVALIASLLAAIVVGLRSDKIGVKQYFLAAVFALAVVAIAMVHMFTMEKPPEF